MPKVFVAIQGKNHSGKTTAARILVSDFGFDQISLADSLKESYAMAMGIPIADLYNPIRKEDHRIGMQSWGTVEREKFQDCFVVNFTRKLYCKDRVVCDDLRFFNEWEGFDLLNMVPLRIKASKEVRLELGHKPDPIADAHPSECELDSIPDSEFLARRGAVLVNLGKRFYREYVEDILGFAQGVVEKN